MPNIKKTYLLLPLLAALLAASSCGMKQERDTAAEKDVLKVRISTRDLTTKATVPGDDAYGENAVQTLSAFVYRDAQETSPAFFRADGITPSGGLAQCFIPGDVLAQIAADGGDCTLVLAANTAVAAGSPTLTELLSAPAGSDFGVETQTHLHPMWAVTTASLDATGRVLEATAQLKRSSARLDLRITELATDVQDGDTRYIPDTDHMQVILHKSLSRGTLGGLEHASAGNESAFDLGKGPLQPVSDTQTGDLLYYQTATPFYTMAKDWSADETRAMLFVLIVPWSEDGGNTWKTTYYQIPVNAAQLKAQENTRYIVNMRIGIVGSFEEETAVTLQPTIITQDWSQFNLEESVVTESRYLVVANTTLTLDNETRAEIQYTSSHNCEIKSQTLSKEDLTETGNPDIIIPASEYTLQLTDDRLIFEHALDNSGEATADFAPYTLTVTIGHADNDNYVQTITITQQPMIYVVSDMNSDGENNNYKGYVFVNSYQSNSSSTQYYGGVHGLTGTNKNPNMYIISLSAFSAGSEYTIGDPRTPYVDNMPTYSNAAVSVTWAQSKTSIQGTTRRISWYHPTESGERTRMMLAPKFRVASSYGVTRTLSYEDAQKRCASYQEDGFPAGRWRIPTWAEIKYISSLSMQGTIPTLFSIDANETTGYWCANGWVGGDAQGNPSYNDDFTGSRSTRCVYDDWYWGSERAVNRSTFTWGDSQ